MKVHVRAGEIRLAELRTRMPFKYGIATLTHAPHAFVRLQAEVDGKQSAGVAADILPPKWFTKDPTRPVADEVDEMLRVIEHAVSAAVGLRGDSVFGAWRTLWDAQAARGEAEGLPPLLTHFGTSLVERALIDAACRAALQPFAVLLRQNAFGMRPGDIHPPLAGLNPADLLPARPLERIIARHTVGLADPITDEDITPEERLDDGLPQSLAACIQTYGLRHFKVKVSGDRERDWERLSRVASVIAEHAPAGFAFSLDGNEQFSGAVEFRAYWQALAGDPLLRPFFQHLLFVEQPLHRDLALRGEAVGSLKDWKYGPPLIIDESDGDLDSLPRALELGYAGTSHKNCKGVFKGVANACLLEKLRRDQPGRPLIMSGEDLANVGPVALPQDLAVCASLGVRGVERNGHHYFAGLSMFPAAMQRQVLESHGDLYHPSRDGWPTLRVRDGEIDVGSVTAAPFGVKPLIDVGQFLTVDAWRAKAVTAG